jgi:hypothetical protein
VERYPCQPRDQSRSAVCGRLRSPICGALSAAYLTLPFVHYVRASGWPLPVDELQTVLASAFMIGTCGMWLADILFEMVVRRFKPASDDD